MIKVLVIPGIHYDAGQFLELVRQRGGVLYIAAGSGAVCGEDATRMLILELRGADNPCDFGADIVVVGSDAPDVRRLPCGCVKKDAMIIFDPQDIAQCSFVARRGYRLITCGSGERNTVSVSSIAEDAIVLSVGRDVRNAYGQMVEVQDYVFHAKIWDVPTAVLASTLLLLTEEGI